MSTDKRQGLVGAPPNQEDAEADRLQILQDLNDVLVRIESRGQAFQDEEWWGAFTELHKQLMKPAEPPLRYPRQGMLGGKKDAEANARLLNEQGNLAWVQAEYGPDHGHENVYWGHRVWYFTPEDFPVIVAMADAEEAPPAAPTAVAYPEEVQLLQRENT